MKLKIKNKPRKFKVGIKKVTLKHFGEIYLKSNNQVTFINKKSEFDIVKKNWGYYATPSVNKRLKRFGFRTFLTQNRYKSIYVMLVHKEKVKEFRKHLKDDKIKIIKELTNGYN